MPDEIPRKLFYKIGEVCQLTDTQPYVLRFWESEFPQLAPTKSRSGQRLYRRKDIDLVLEIKQLLYQEGFTIAGARKKLGMGDERPVLEELFDSVRPPVPPAETITLRSVVSGLRDLLRTMDETDRRLHPRSAPRRR
ncbi:MAG TPA: MerR family transcriptional regulator [Candidatus Polarisedimenticolia bacterium]|nr:MerR family transcriptional regulator [Candidatus Polarisedimenticolia bacterium]